MLEMTKTDDGRLRVDFGDGTVCDILMAVTSDKSDARLIDMAHHHFNAYEAMVAKLKEEMLIDSINFYSSSHRDLIDALLAIAESKVLKVGDVVPAGEVPIGAKVEIKGIVGAKIRRKSVNDGEIRVCFDCELCGAEGTRLIATNTECTIVELPDKG